MVISRKLLHSQTSYLVSSRESTIQYAKSNDISFLDLKIRSKSHVKIKYHIRGGVCVLWIRLVFMSVAVFLLHLFIIFGVGLSVYLSNHNPFSREHIFVGFNQFPSLVCWGTVIHHHRSQRPTLFRKVRWDFTCVQCNVYTDTGPPVVSPVQKD